MRKLNVVGVVGVLLFAGEVSAGTVKVDWTPDTTSCADGTPMTGCPITGFEISESGSLNATYSVKEVVGPTVVSKTYSNIAPGTKCYAVKQLSGDFKSADKRACVAVASLPPKAPLGLTVTVVVTVETAAP